MAKNPRHKNPRYDESGSLDGGLEYKAAIQAFNDGCSLAKRDKNAAVKKFEKAENGFTSCGDTVNAELARTNIKRVQSGDEPQPLA